LQLNPNDATAHQWFANDTLANVGQNERELTEMKRAVELDPLSLVINSNLGWAYIHLGRLDEAIAQLRKTVEMDGGFYYARYALGLALELKGAIPEAIAEYQKAIAITEDPFRSECWAGFTLRRVEKMTRRKSFNSCASDESNITLRLTHWLWFISAWVITMRRSTGSSRVIRSATALTSGQSVLIRSSLRFAAIRVSKRSLRRSFLRASSPVVRPQRDEVGKSFC
jgi:FOG: TPR repeat